MAKKRIGIVWENDLDTLVEQFVERYGDEMKNAQVPTHTLTSGQWEVNRGGVLKFALRKLLKDNKS